MVPTLLAERRSVRAHHPLGASTGYMAEHRGDWEALVKEALEVSTVVVELAAMRESELGGLMAYLRSEPVLPFRYLSVHAPSKGRELPEPELVAHLAELPDSVDAIVVHPDVMVDPGVYEQLGRSLVIENMDARKQTGQRVEGLAELFEVLPEAGFCFDVAHAWSVDPTMELATDLLDHFAQRLRHVHVSSLSDEGKHLPLTEEQEEAFLPVLSRCSDVPWVLEAPPRGS